MEEKILNSCEKTIEYSFYTLVFLVPLVFTPLTFELFEFPKMILVYFLTTLITAAFLTKSIVNGRLSIRRTPLDKPIAAFLLVNILATVFSIDRYTSVFGYYTRFNGGLLSLVCYVALYYIFVGEMGGRGERGGRFIKLLLLSAILVSIYGILQHFGIDKDYWVQDVQRRIFSTLGQPNWLAAFLVMVIPVSLALQNVKSKPQMSKLTYIVMPVILYAAFWFTYSLSGLLGFAAAMLTFFVFVGKEDLKQNLRPLLLIFFIWAAISALTLTPTISGRLQKIFEVVPQVSAANELERGPDGKEPRSESPETGSTVQIRLAVWEGTLNLIKDRSLLGTGPETFAYAFLPYRPAKLNQTAEWEFLYNKAHNEYLNLAACTGLIGLAAYLWLILKFSIWSMKHRDRSVLQAGLFAGWAGVVVSNFFGFSVVVTSLLFWLYMALSVSGER